MRLRHDGRRAGIMTGEERFSFFHFLYGKGDRTLSGRLIDKGRAGD